MIRLIIFAFLMTAVAGLLSCGEDTPPASQTQVVKKKIVAQERKPDIQSAEKEVQKDKDPSAQAVDQKDKTSSESETSTPVTSKLVKESMAYAGGYTAKGRFDPFEPLFKEKQEERPATSKRSRPVRKNRTPLERVAISQLKLSAIMRTTKGNSAIVEDATGKGYVIRKGTYIGLNSGQVVKIDKNRVMIEEESEDISGEFRIHNTELKLQKPAGEL